MKRTAGKVSSRRVPGLDYVQVVKGEDVSNDFPRHVHSTLSIGTVDRGARVIMQRGESALIPAHSLFVINPGASHSCKSGDGRGHSYRIACVDVEAAAAAASQISEKDRPILRFKKVLLDDSDLRARLHRFFSLIETADPGRESFFFSFLCDLVIRHGDFQPASSDAAPRKNAVARACEFIRANHAGNIPLDQLAQVACLSPFHFQRAFVTAMGISPHDYQVQCRIRKARELLHEGHGITDAALETGFADQSHFTRCFKRLMGTSPGRYVREMRGGGLSSRF
jgi:AraC-like DNA-binding protein